MFGYSVAEVVGRNVRMLTAQPDRDRHDGYIERYLKTGEARIIGVGRHVKGQRKDGTTFPLELAVSQIGAQRRFTGIMRDLSAQLALETRLADSQLAERRHMARELHDDIGGHMTGIGLLAQSLHVELDRMHSPAALKTAELVESIRVVHQRLRALIRGLMPVETIPEGLMAALENLARQSETTSGIPCKFLCDPPVRVADAGTALHLFRIAQEAIHNAVRHSQATQITLSLQRDGGDVVIAVTDNGRGVGEVPPGHGGIGLASMRQRARLLGGDCAVQPQQGGGTLVKCRVPSPESHDR